MSVNPVQPGKTARATKPALPSAERLESLQASIKVLRSGGSSIPKLSEVLLARTAEQRRAVEGAVLAAERWLESSRRAIEVCAADPSLTRHTAQLEALRAESLELKLVLSERSERMRSIYSSPDLCPPRATVLSAADLAELTTSMVELRERFWSSLYSFPVAYSERLHVLQRLLLGELSWESCIFLRPSDGRAQRGLLSEVRRVLKLNNANVSKGVDAALQPYDSALGAALGRLPELPEAALERSTLLEHKAESLLRLESEGAAESKSLALELGGDASSCAARVAAMITARNSYLLVKSYLFAANKGWADKLAGQRAARVAEAHQPDVHQGAYLGLLRGIERWDPSGDSGFAGYTKGWILQSIGRETRGLFSTIAMPGGMVPLINSMRKLTDTEARDLDVQEAAETHGVSAELVCAARLLSRGVVSLNSMRGRNDDRSELSSGIADSRTNAPSERICSEEARDEALRLMQKLPPREQDVLKLKFGLDGAGESRSLGEVGERLGLSRERVRQLERRALGRLRLYLERVSGGEQ